MLLLEQTDHCTDQAQDQQCSDALDGGPALALHQEVAAQSQSQRQQTGQQKPCLEVMNTPATVF